MKKNQRNNKLPELLLIVVNDSFNNSDLHLKLFGISKNIDCVICI